MSFIYIALGSNLKNPRKQVLNGILSIKKLDRVKILKESYLYQTPPVGILNQPDFINAVIKISSDYSGEEIDLECNLKIGMAKDNGAYNVASTCCFINTPDLVKANEKWNDIEKNLKSESIKTLTPEEIEYQIESFISSHS